MDATQQNLPLFVRVRNWLWTFLKLPFTVTIVRSIGTISSVVAATIAIFIDAEGIKKRATADGQIQWKPLGREALADRFVRKVFIFIVIANLIFLFGDYLKDRATDDSNDATSRKIIDNTKSATNEAEKTIETVVTQISRDSGNQIVTEVASKADEINQEQEQIAQSARSTLDSIRETQNAFYDTRTDLTRVWREGDGSSAYPKICKILDKWNFDQDKLITVSTDPDVVALVTDDAINDEVVSSDLNNIEATVGIADNWQQENPKDRNRVVWATFTGARLDRSDRIAGVYEVHSYGGIGSKAEVYFNSLAPDSCEEHLSLFSDALPDDFPDRSIADLGGKTLRVVTSHRESPTSSEMTPQIEEGISRWRLSAIYFGEMKMVVNYPDSADFVSRDIARLRWFHDPVAPGYEFQFPKNWKDLISLFDYRPYKNRNP